MKGKARLKWGEPRAVVLVVCVLYKEWLVNKEHGKLTSSSVSERLGLWVF